MISLTKAPRIVSLIGKSAKELGISEDELIDMLDDGGLLNLIDLAGKNVDKVPNPKLKEYKFRHFEAYNALVKPEYQNNIDDILGPTDFPEFGELVTSIDNGFIGIIVRKAGSYLRNTMFRLDGEGWHCDSPLYIREAHSWMTFWHASIKEILPKLERKHIRESYLK